MKEKINKICLTASMVTGLICFTEIIIFLKLGLDILLPLHKINISLEV